MRYVLNVERLTVENLVANNESRDSAWRSRLKSKIPHLDGKLELILDSPVCYNMLEDEEGQEPTLSERITSAQLALLALELVLGRDYIQSQLEGKYPSAFIAAAIEAFQHIDACIPLDQPQEAEDPALSSATFTAYFISIYAFNRAVEDDTYRDPLYQDRSAYPPDAVSGHCAHVLGELDIPQTLDELLRQMVVEAGVASEIHCLQPTFH